MDEPNYRQLQPDPDKDMTEYTYVERRAKIYDLINEAGHYRNIEQSTRQLGERMGVSHVTIQKDIRRVNEWIADNMGEEADAELETLKNKAVRDLIDRGDTDQAYKIMKEHYQMLQEIGVKDREPDEIKMDWREYVSQ